MARKRLTQIAIEKARHDPSKRVEVPDGNGLYLVLQPSGAKTWAFRYRRPDTGKPAKLTLGAVRLLRDREEEPTGTPQIGEPMTLAQARAAATQTQLGLIAREDPGAVVQAAKVKEAASKDRELFEVAAERFLERHARPNTKASTLNQTANVLGFANGADGKLELRDARDRKHGRPLDTWPATRWRGRKVQTITKGEVNDLLDAIVDAEGPSPANSTLAAVRKLFNWLIERGDLKDSPCAGVKKRGGGVVERDRVLSDAELRLVWLGAGEIGWPFGHLVRLLILTAARRDEWAEGRGSEIGHNTQVFHLPKERSKNGLAHDIPLSSQSLEVLEDLAKYRLDGKPDWLFSTGQGRATAAADAPLRPISGFSKAKIKLDAAISAIIVREAEEAGVEPMEMLPWRLHDLRRTAVTGMARLGVPLPVVEKAINHISGSFAGVVRVYQRHDYSAEVREALERWGAAVERVVAGETLVANNIVRIRA